MVMDSTISTHRSPEINPIMQQLLSAYKLLSTHNPGTSKLLSTFQSLLHLEPSPEVDWVKQQDMTLAGFKDYYSSKSIEVFGS